MERPFVERALKLGRFQALEHDGILKSTEVLVVEERRFVNERQYSMMLPHPAPKSLIPTHVSCWNGEPVILDG
jgi:hypothetical protein